MPIQSDNPPELHTIQQWKGLNQQATRGSIDDDEEYWNENLFAIGPGNLRSCWGHGPAIYTAPSGVQILRIFFGFIGNETPQFQAPPPGQLGWMFLSDGTIDQVDLSTHVVTHVGGAGRQVWNPVPPMYWADAVVWRPQFFGSTAGQPGGVLFGSPEGATSGGLYAWDGTTLSAPGDPAPDWLTDQQETTPGPNLYTMPKGLPGIYTMEVYQSRLWVAGKDVIAFSAPSNGADFSTTDGGGSIGYFGNKLVYSYMDLAASADYLYCFGDSSIDVIANVNLTGAGTPQSPFTTIFNYANIDPQTGQRFPRPVGRIGRYLQMWNGAGIFELQGAEARAIGNKVTNIFNTLDTSLYLPTMAPATMFGFKVLLCNGRFTDPFGIKRNLLLMWHPVRGSEFWSIASQNLELTNINSYEQDSIITPYGTDGTSLYQLFATPDEHLPKRLSTKFLSGQQMQMLTIKNWKRVFLEMTDISGEGVSVHGVLTTRAGGVPGGAQEIGFELSPAGQSTDYGIEDKRYGMQPWPVQGAGISAAVDLNTLSPDFVIERLHILTEERTLWGA